ncbi:copper transporter [Thermoanaerobacterium sp. RBIITD]|uniref:copper transporter n=1 Tax=Thermoanaerobacterium sp. RBIITD TaxID=1550240 RepID=UPI000BB90B4E|nr:copper transporter [Thermoanaerobacterium sp. RBIITD]SNX55381.1 Copper transport outer membrane protein, MctB [Thermoanaerobacterium sp. RBIITD]
MNVNIRYYVLTIAAIFMALGIGIFIGFMLDGQKAFSEQQDTIINQLEQKFKDIQTENSNLKDNVQSLNKQLDYMNQYNKIIFPELVKNRLTGVKVAIMETNNDFIYPGMRNALIKAGATINSITIFKDSLNNLSDSDKKDLIDFLSKYGKVDENHIIEFLSQKLSNAIITGQDSDLINFLKDKGYIDFSGTIGGTDFVVLAGGSNNKNNNVNIIDIPIIKQVKNLNIPIVGVEQSDVKYTYMEAYKKQRLSTIDNIDSVIGQTSLIMVMQGKEGNYGIKPGDTSIMPDSFIEVTQQNQNSMGQTR